MCGRAGGVDLLVILPNPGSTASHTNTICHHSHLESAAGDWTCTGCYRRIQAGTGAYWWVLVRTGGEGEAGLGPHTSRCSLRSQTGAEVEGGGGSTLVVGCAQQLRHRGARRTQRSGQDAEERRGDAVTHVRLSTLSLRLPLSIHRGGTQSGRLDTGTPRDAAAGPPNTINNTEPAPERPGELRHCWSGSPADHRASCVTEGFCPR